MNQKSESFKTFLPVQKVGRMALTAETFAKLQQMVKAEPILKVVLSTFGAKIISIDSSRSIDNNLV